MYFGFGTGFENKMAERNSMSDARFVCSNKWTRVLNWTGSFQH